MKFAAFLLVCLLVVLGSVRTEARQLSQTVDPCPGGYTEKKVNYETWVTGSKTKHPCTDLKFVEVPDEAECYLEPELNAKGQKIGVIKDLALESFTLRLKRVGQTRLHCSEPGEPELTARIIIR